MGRPKSRRPKVLVTRRLRADLWERTQAYAAGLSPQTTDTAVIEAALEEYLARHEPKTKKGEK